MKDIIASGNMDEGSMDHILKAMDDMRAGLNDETDNKLNNFVK